MVQVGGKQVVFVGEEGRVAHGKKGIIPVDIEFMTSMIIVFVSCIGLIFGVRHASTQLASVIGKLRGI